MVREVETVGIRDPGVFPAALDLTEALVGCRRVTDAAAVLAALEEIAAEQQHPWGLAATARGRGLLAAAAGDDAGAVQLLTEAIASFSQLGLQFDAARARLDLGIVHRRGRRRLEARRELEAARDELKRLGAPAFAARAEAEIERLGRRGAANGMTATERRVAALVVQGYTNRQVADELFVTVSTVQAHLTRIYAKHGVQSRTQLVKLLATD